MSLGRVPGSLGAKPGVPGQVAALVRVTDVRRPLGMFVSFMLAAVLALAGCGQDTETAPERDPSPPSAVPTEGSDPPSSPSPTASPATGERLELANVSVRVPKGFRADPPDLSYLRFAFERAGVQSIALGNTPAVNAEVSLRDQARISIRNNVYSQAPTIEEPVEVGGLTMYHYAGRVNETEHVEEYGTIYDGSQLSVNFLLSAAAPDSERRQLVESVLATLDVS